MHSEKLISLHFTRYSAFLLTAIVLLAGCEKIEPERVFKVTTISVGEVTKNSVLVTGNIKDLGSQPITQHGFCASIESVPTISSAHVVQLGSAASTGDYSSDITGLSPGTSYFVRAYLTNSDSTTYGRSLTFKTGLPDKPSVSTATPSFVTMTTAVVGGEVTGDGGGTVTERGVYYGTSSDPLTTGIKVAIGSGVGEFSSQLTSLAPGQKYYVVAYAINSAGSSNGSVSEFTTPTEVSRPTVSTAQASSIEMTTAIVGGNVTSEGGGTVTERGIYYGTGSDPMTSGMKIAVGSGLGEFSTQLTSLTPGQKYYVVAYAINSAGSSSGAIEQFTTSTVVNKPTVITTPASSIEMSTAIVGGNVTSEGGGTVSERGIYYGTGTNPVSTGVKIAIGTGLGTFSTQLTGLTPGQKYYVVAYATNSAGSSNGSTEQFTTPTAVVVPTVTTSQASSVSETTAVVGGNVSGDGGGTVSERGVYYGTGSDPMTSGMKVSIGSGMGEFSSQLTGLTPGQKYYVVAYAVNSAGSSSGTVEAFTTLSSVVKATVSTTPASSIQKTTAIVGGNVSNDGGGTVTERGIYYGTNSDPLSTGIKIAIGSGMGSFSTQLSGLSQNQKYYVVAYAINSAGSSNGTVETFTTLSDNTVTDIDGNIYSTVVVGDQTLMAENLRVTRYSNGASIPLLTDPNDWRALGFTDKAYGYYNNDPSDAATYGALYNWAAAMNGAGSSDANPSGVQGVCPSGWHLPSDAEWKELEIYLGMTSTVANTVGKRGSPVGGKMKDLGYWNSPNTGATNTSGFNGRGHGTVDYWGHSYYNKGGEGLYWSATEALNNNAYSRGLYYDTDAVARWDVSIKGNGLAVRCIKD